MARKGRAAKLAAAAAENEGTQVKHSPLVAYVDAALNVEKGRVAAQVRLSHLKRRGATCSNTVELHRRIEELEDWIDGNIAEFVGDHPAAPWFSRVKGTGGVAIGQVVGLIDGFGRYYPVGDPMIPPGVNREPELVVLKEGEEPVQAVWVEAIERFVTPSKLRKFAGLVPGQRREAGKKIEFSSELRVMLYRLGVSLLRAQGKYAEFYEQYRAHLEQRLTSQGIKIRPTPTDRYCPTCDGEVKVKKGLYCPTCGTRLAKKDEPEGVMWQSHVHAMCLRRMLQLFLDHFWAIYREAQGLPLRTPYPIEFLGHETLITPWDMVDYEEKKRA